MAVDISIVQGDLGTQEADILLLKHAQAFYGADADIAGLLERHGLCTEADLRLPINESKILPTRGTPLAASRVMFIGTARLSQFRYSEMERFAARAIQEIAKASLPIESLATTVHGAGYGLDIEEALQALIRGFERGLARHPLPGLRTITFVEMNARRAQALQGCLDSLPSRKIELPANASDVQPVAIQSAPKRKVFVAMPFSEEFEDVYRFGIYDVVRRAGYVCERVDEKAVAGNIVDQIREGIQSSDFVIADLSAERPNVYLEVGYAWGLQRTVLLLWCEGTHLHFDVSQHKCIFYKTIGKLAEGLEHAIQKLRGDATKP